MVSAGAVPLARLPHSATVQSKHGPRHPRSLYGIAAEQRDALHERFADLVGCREWRDQLPWLADAYSTDLFGQLFFEQVVAEDIREHPEGSDLSAAAFIHAAGDETDALALVFVLRDLPSVSPARIGIRDPDNPISQAAASTWSTADFRTTALESILVRRPIFQTHARASASRCIRRVRSGLPSGPSRGRTASVDPGASVHGMRDSRPSSRSRRGRGSDLARLASRGEGGRPAGQPRERPRLRRDRRFDRRRGALRPPLDGLDDDGITAHRPRRPDRDDAIFLDENGRMNHDLAGIGGAALVVSQFTLYADTLRGHRPRSSRR